MGVKEKLPETRGAKTDPSYVLMAEYIAQHIGEPTLTVGFLTEKFNTTKTVVRFHLLQIPSVDTQGGVLGFSEDADMETLQEEVEMARQKAGRHNFTKTAVERQTPSHLHGGRYVHRRRA